MLYKGKRGERQGLTLTQAGAAGAERWQAKHAAARDTSFVGRVRRLPCNQRRNRDRGPWNGGSAADRGCGSTPNNPLLIQCAPQLEAIEPAVTVRTRYSQALQTRELPCSLKCMRHLNPLFLRLSAI